MEGTEPPYPLVREWGKDDVLAWDKVASWRDRGGRVRMAGAVGGTISPFL
jgi:hypothetical protein